VRLRARRQPARPQHCGSDRHHGILGRQVTAAPSQLAMSLRFHLASWDRTPWRNDFLYRQLCCRVARATPTYGHIATGQCHGCILHIVTPLTKNHTNTISSQTCAVELCACTCSCTCSATYRKSECLYITADFGARYVLDATVHNEQEDDEHAFTKRPVRGRPR
jgi:hypothetical protein